MKITGRKTALTYAGAESKFGIACESATPSEAKQTTPSDDEHDQLDPVLRPVEPEHELARQRDERRPGAPCW